MDAKKRNPGLSSGIQAWVFEKVCLKLTYTGFIEKNLLDFEITSHNYSLNRIALHLLQSL